jgi:hypothetical protein
MRPRVLAGAGCAGVPKDALWATAGVLAITAGAGAEIAAGAATGRISCAGALSVGATVVVGAGAAGSTFRRHDKLVAGEHRSRSRSH